MLKKKLPNKEQLKWSVGDSWHRFLISSLWYLLLFYCIILKLFMCISDSKVYHQQTKETFHKIKEERKKYAKERQLPKVTLCMLEYMEYILSCKVGWADDESQNILSFLPCFRNSKNHNVREEFRRAFTSCSTKEQLDYYRKFVENMIGKDFSLPNPKANL